MIKIIKKIAVVGFAAASVFAVPAVSSIADLAHPTHWTVDAGRAR